MAKDLRFQSIGSQMAIALQLEMAEAESGPFQASHSSTVASLQIDPAICWAFHQIVAL